MKTQFTLVSLLLLLAACSAGETAEPDAAAALRKSFDAACAALPGHTDPAAALAYYQKQYPAALFVSRDEQSSYTLTGFDDVDNASRLTGAIGVLNKTGIHPPAPFPHLADEHAAGRLHNADLELARRIAEAILEKRFAR